MLSGEPWSLNQERVQEVNTEMSWRASHAQQHGDDGDVVMPWLTVLIQDVSGLRARVEELERRLEIE